VSVVLRAMTPAEYEAWRERSTSSYALDIEREMGWTTKAARAKAQRDFRDLLPRGLESKHQRLLTAADAESGEHVGHLWFGEREYGGQRIAFVWDILVFEQARGRGYGRAIMSALEPLVREAGLDRIDLNVFGTNLVARALYRSLGYQEASISMSKRLD